MLDCSPKPVGGARANQNSDGYPCGLATTAPSSEWAFGPYQSPTSYSSDENIQGIAHAVQPVEGWH
jgi:hypothetical protein